MATVNTTTTMDGLFKRIYADKLKDLIPKNAKLIKRVPFETRKKLGDTFEQPVCVANEGGVTYALAGAGAFPLNDAIAMTTKNARVPSLQMVMRSQMDLETAAKATSGGDAAFRASIELMVQSMTNSTTHRLECSMLYGSTGLGQISTASAVSSTVTTVTISALTWAIGIWAGCENHKVDIYESAGQVGAASFTITSVDPENKQMNLTGSVSDSTILVADATGTGVGLDIFFKGSYGNDMNGIDKIITNTGNLFGIDASAYNLWKGNSYAAAGAITVDKLLKCTTVAIGKGGLNEGVVAYLSPTNFAVINAEVEGYRRLDSSYSTKKTSLGSEGFALYCQSGIMEIEPHSMVKDGEAFIGPVSTIKRIGACDVQYTHPGMDEKFFHELNDNAGFELRNYSNQAIFINEPAKWTKMTGITV